MSWGLSLDDDEVAAIHALAAHRAAFVDGRSLNRVQVLAEAARMVLRALRGLWGGHFSATRLEQVADVLVHDHSDRQFMRLIANEFAVDVEVVGRPMSFSFARHRPALQVAVVATVLRNAHRAGLWRGTLHCEHVLSIVKAFCICGAVDWGLKSGAVRPRALVLSGDFDFARLLVGAVAARAAVPLAIVLHDYGRRWRAADAPWISALHFRWAVVHDVRHVVGLAAKPEAVCLIPAPRVERFHRVVGGLTVGIVVDAFVSPRATFDLAETVARSPRVHRVLIRLHPRTRADTWPMPTREDVAYADPRSDLGQFAGEIDLAITSATTAAYTLMRAGLQCLWWDGFYVGMQNAFEHDVESFSLDSATEESAAMGVRLWRLARHDGPPGAESSDPDSVVPVRELLRELGLRDYDSGRSSETTPQPEPRRGVDSAPV